MKLSEKEIKEIQSSKYHKGEFIINCLVDKKSKTITLVYDDYNLVVVPFSEFKPSGFCSPDFDNVSIIDSGFTLKLGEYEASSRALLD